jgi:hypothetical protein
MAMAKCFGNQSLLVGGNWNHGILCLSHHIGVMSSSQLTIRPSFFRGVGSTTNQLMVKIPMMVKHNHHY